ncbi:MAG: hypothetical protein EOP62_10440 [Sphingomonadales bacterium]|nr:MAG: hypothetical protein EOP62_10440 [Sphingomonadales bacterium]
MTARIIVQTPTGTGQARTATLTFDDRPAGVVLDMPDSRYSTANSRDIFLPADFLDRLAYVSSMTLTLKAANGDVLNRYIFDVADAREVRPELISANWSCVSAR